MRIKLPIINGEDRYIENKQSIVLIGANGSGKTRMSIWIDENNPNVHIHRISAQKSLNMPAIVSPTELEIAQEKFLYGTSDKNKTWLKHQGKKSSRWGNKPETHLLNDFDKLMEFLMTENFEKSIEYREYHKEGNKEFDNETRLEKIKKIWENVITHRKLKIRAGKIEVTKTESSYDNDYYNGSEMSDGERAIFYFIGEALSVPAESLIIVDEPENHLHKSILVRLWNAIEVARQDCTFLYITHSLEFASSRINTQIIWVKGQRNSQWDYELIEDVGASDSLMLEILGNRQKVLLVEGTPDKSLDRKLYAILFPEYNVIPVDNCNTVIQYTKAYKNLLNIHYVEVKGIIDRDRKSDEEIASYNRKNIFTPDVAEIESLFLLPEVIRIVCIKQSKEEEYESILSAVQDRTIEFLTREVDAQALLFTKQKCQNDIYRIVNDKVNSIEEYKNNISSLKNTINVDGIFDESKQELSCIIDNRDFLGALKVINNKGLLSYTGLSNFFGWKKDYYINYVLRLLSAGDKTSDQLKLVFKTYIKLVE